MPPIIITSNKRFDKWVDFRGDASITTAILNQINHYYKSVNITGDSYCLAHHHSVVGKN